VKPSPPMRQIHLVEDQKTGKVLKDLKTILSDISLTLHALEDQGKEIIAAIKEPYFLDSVKGLTMVQVIGI
jgi:hypothetical protein